VAVDRLVQLIIGVRLQPLHQVSTGQAGLEDLLQQQTELRVVTVVVAYQVLAVGLQLVQVQGTILLETVAQV
jgi:hypothetical protein